MLGPWILTELLGYPVRPPYGQRFQQRWEVQLWRGFWPLPRPTLGIGRLTAGRCLVVGL